MAVFLNLQYGGIFKNTIRRKFLNMAEKAGSLN
jgi:hypothetical protein